MRNIIYLEILIITFVKINKHGQNYLSFLTENESLAVEISIILILIWNYFITKTRNFEVHGELNPDGELEASKEEWVNS